MKNTKVFITSLFFIGGFVLWVMFWEHLVESLNICSNKYMAGPVGYLFALVSAIGLFCIGMDLAKHE